MPRSRLAALATKYSPRAVSRAESASIPAAIPDGASGLRRDSSTKVAAMTTANATTIKTIVEIRLRTPNSFFPSAHTNLSVLALLFIVPPFLTL